MKNFQNLNQQELRSIDGGKALSHIKPGLLDDLTPDLPVNLPTTNVLFLPLGV